MILYIYRERVTIFNMCFIIFSTYITWDFIFSITEIERLFININYKIIFIQCIFYSIRYRNIMHVIAN